MKSFRFFAVLCCAAAVFAACDKTDEPANDDQNDNNTPVENPDTVICIENGHEYVDLGLPSGLKWATCNVGAAKPEEYGDYFAWGETEPKDNYSWDTYKYGIYDYDCKCAQLTKYSNWGYGLNDYRDGLTVLEPEDDAASVNWGGKWRMPTIDEWEELIDNCDWTWTTDYDGQVGFIVTSNANDNGIFLPAAGCRYDGYLDGAGGAGDDGRYWSSSLRTYYPDNALYVRFDSDYVRRRSNDRCFGQSVRPVLP